MKNDRLTCRFCGAPVSAKSHNICGAVACLLKRNAEVSRAYTQQNREKINEQRRERYQRQQQKQLSMSQGAALHALWQEGHLIQMDNAIISPSTLQHVCHLTVIRYLEDKGLAVFVDDRWLPVLQRDEFATNGYTILDRPRRKYPKSDKD